MKTDRIVSNGIVAH